MVVREDERMDDLVRFLQARVDEDEHRYAYVGHTFGGDALLDSHLHAGYREEWQP